MALASDADDIEALQHQETLPENANLTDEELVKYLKEHQTLYEVNDKEVDPVYKENTMHLDEQPQNRVRRSYMARRKFPNPRLYPMRPTINDDYSDIPESFDARKKWSYCLSIHQIRDQADCGWQSMSDNDLSELHLLVPVRSRLEPPCVACVLHASVEDGDLCGFP
ncbi:hypothetical protein TELCIR_12020 [Teladorsagia circumcincta]|uniref:Uncharacterized protein n=1 Tax=Teladorsagia circumcincta TaxID=45464 RepID=A0A2G9U7X3_TELCI|nr:hypothetical protein TELCIR_12020 [Teladorsagia circumcincta]